MRRLEVQVQQVKSPGKRTATGIFSHRWNWGREQHLGMIIMTRLGLQQERKLGRDEQMMVSCNVDLEQQTGSSM